MIALSSLMFILLGSFAGVLSGLIGIGGGVVLVPALVILFGFTQHLAQGTTLVLMVPPIGILAARAYYKKGQVDLVIAALLCVGFAAGGLLGAKLAEVISNGLLERIFGIGLAAIALRMLTAPDQASSTVNDNNAAPARGVLGSVLLVVLGFAVGTLSGLLGIGGGVVMVPALVFIVGLSQHKAQGTTLALMVPPVGLLASWQYFQKGDVDLVAGGWICLGFFLGALLGAYLASMIPSRILTKVFGISMLLIALKMLFLA